MRKFFKVNALILLAILLSVSAWATVSDTTTPTITYNGNDATVNFTIPFTYVASTDIVAVHTDGTGAQTTWTLNGAGDTGYTISGATLTANTAPATGTTLTIYRDTAKTQSLDLAPNRAFSAELLETAFDRLTLITQDVEIQPAVETYATAAAASATAAASSAAAASAYAGYVVDTETEAKAAGASDIPVILGADITLTSNWTPTCPVIDTNGFTITLGAYDLDLSGVEFHGTPGCFNENSTGVVKGLGDVAPELWGAQGDGDPTDDSAGTNDSAAFANAIACLKTTPNVGGILRLGAKCYKTNFEVCSNLTIQGTSARATKLIPATDGPVIYTSLTTSTVRLNIIDVGIDGGELCATNTSQDGIRLKCTTAGTFVDEVRIVRCHINNCGRYGLYAYGNVTTTPANGTFTQALSLRDTRISGSYSNNIYFEGEIFEVVFDHVFPVGGMSADHSVFLDATAGGRTNRLKWTGGGVNCSNYSTSGKAVYIEGGQQIGIENVDFEAADVMLYLTNALTRDISLKTCMMTSNDNITSGIEIANVDGLSLENVNMTSGGTLTYGIYSAAANSAVKNLDFKNLRINATTPISIINNHTIASGVIYAYKKYQRVYAESGTADDLDYIYDWSATSGTSTAFFFDGYETTIIPQDATHTITVTNAGNILTNSGASVALVGNTKPMRLRWSSNLSKFVQVGGVQ